MAIPQSSDIPYTARSTLAQCYLEHLRLWTANATGHWLCNRIESAGAGVQSTFLSSAISANFINDVMDTVDVKGQPLDAGAIEVFNRSIAAVGGHCRETRALVERMKTLKRRAVDERILLGARHIVCFGDFTPKLLLKLKAYAMNQSPAGISKDVSGNENGQVTLLKSDFLEMNASDAQLEKALANVKEQVNEFVARELNWTQPGVKIWQGMYRTRQFCVPWDKREAVQAKQEEIRKKYDCKHIKTYYAAPELGMLVTVIGPKDVEKLDKVEEDLKALL